MPLPRIVATEPVIISAIPEKTFPDWWLDGLFVRINADGTSNAQLRYHRYNYDTGEHNIDIQRSILVNDVWAKAAQSETFASAMVAIAIAAGEALAEDDVVVPAQEPVVPPMI